MKRRNREELEIKGEFSKMKDLTSLTKNKNLSEIASYRAIYCDY